MKIIQKSQLKAYASRYISERTIDIMAAEEGILFLWATMPFFFLLLAWMLDARKWYFAMMKIFAVAMSLATGLGALGVGFEIAQANAYSSDVLTSMSNSIATYTRALWTFMMFGFGMLLWFTFDYMRNLLGWKVRKK